MNFVKIFGMMRTGTNYVHWLIENNFRNVHVFMHDNIFGWKHGKIPNELDWSGKGWIYPENKENLNYLEKYKKVAESLRDEIKSAIINNEFIYVVCIKNPYHGFFSETKVNWPKKKKKDLREYVEEWNEINKNYVNYSIDHNKICHVIRYEDFIESGYEYVLSNLKEKFNLLKNDNYVNQQKKVGPCCYIEKWKFDNTYIKNKAYLNFFSKKELEFVKNNIDSNLMSLLKYEVY